MKCFMPRDLHELQGNYFVLYMRKSLTKILMNVMLILECLMVNMNAPSLPTVQIRKDPTLAHVTKDMNLLTKDVHALTLMNVLQVMVKIF